MNYKGQILSLYFHYVEHFWLYNSIILLFMYLEIHVIYLWKRKRIVPAFKRQCPRNCSQLVHEIGVDFENVKTILLSAFPPYIVLSIVFGCMLILFTIISMFWIIGFFLLVPTKVLLLFLFCCCV